MRRPPLPSPLCLVLLLSLVLAGGCTQDEDSPLFDQGSGPTADARHRDLPGGDISGSQDQGAHPDVAAGDAVTRDGPLTAVDLPLTDQTSPSTWTGQGFPGAAGFGDNRGAFAAPGGVEICIVTSTDDDAPVAMSTRNGVPVVTGGLDTLIDQDPGAGKGKVILFETSGVIDFGGDRVSIKHPYLSIFGQTAPGKGVLLKGAILAVVTGHVVLQHLRIRPGGDRTYSWSNCDNHSALRVETGAA